MPTADQVYPDAVKALAQLRHNALKPLALQYVALQQGVYSGAQCEGLGAASSCTNGLQE